MVMADLPPIVRPAHGARAVRFDHGLARNLAGELRATARTVDDGATERATAAERAQADWRGTNRGEFDEALATQARAASDIAEDCRTQRGRLITAWESANQKQHRLNQDALEAEQERERAEAEEREEPARPTPPVR